MHPRELELDHLVVTCSRLEDGVHFVEDRLGARPIPGGKHAKMGTHNALLKIGDQAYLEVIAPDPEAPRPAGPRWFELDLLALDAPPRLATWVARSLDLTASICPVEEMTRGDLRWRLTVPPDGRLLAGGVIPHLIEWQTSPHPAKALPSVDCQLLSLELAHPGEEVVTKLAEHLPVGVPRVTIARGELRMLARFETPAGMALLRET